MGVSYQKACTPTLTLLSRAMTPSILHRISKAGKAESSGRVLRADSGGGGRCGKNTRIFFSLSWRMRSAPPPHHRSSSSPPPKAHAHLGSRRVLKGRPPRLRQCAQQRTPRPSDLGEPSISITHSRNHGRGCSSFGRTAHHWLVHLPCAAAGEYMPGFGWERAPEAHPGPIIPSRLPPSQPILPQLPRFPSTKVPRWYYLSLPVPVPTSSHRPCPQCARARPGTKTQGCGGRPLRTIATNAVRNTRYTQTRSQEGGGALVCCETLQFSHRKFSP